MQTNLNEVMIRLSQVTAGKWLWDIFRESYDALEIQEGKDKGKMTGPPFTEIYKLESQGDLEELSDVIYEHCKFIANPINAYSFEAPLAKLQQMWNFVNAAQFICEPNDLSEQIPLCHKFEEEQPLLWNLFVTWAWG